MWLLFSIHTLKEWWFEVEKCNRHIRLHVHLKTQAFSMKFCETLLQGMFLSMTEVLGQE